MGNMGTLKRGMQQPVQEPEKPSMLEGQLKPEVNQQVSEEDKRKVEAMQSMVMNFMYRDEVKNEIFGMVKQGQPEKTVPLASTTVYNQLKTMMKNKKGEVPDLETKLALGLSVFGEVIEMSQALGKLPEEIPEDLQEQMLRKVMQDEIEEGLKTGEIDPIDLQAKIEPFLPEDFKEEGAVLIESAGGGMEPSEQALFNQEKTKMTRPLEVENKMLKEQANKQGQALQGLQQAVPNEKQGV